MKKIINACFVASALAVISCSGQNTSQEGNAFIPLEARQQSALSKERVLSMSSAVTPSADFRQAAKKVTLAVVHIKATLKPPEDQNGTYRYRSFRDFWGEDWFHFFEPYREDVPMESSASGVILTDDGYIVTNDHVINNANDIQVVLHDQRSYNARVIGTDPQTDLALLKIDEKNLSFLVLGNSDNVEVGEWVLAVGNPFNLASTVTAGIVSAKARNINILKDRNAIESYIQTDAAVNPGNSGGALVNLDGELIGINSAIATPTGAYAGYAFAIPVNIVKKVTNDLLQFGTVKRGYLGIYIHDMTSEIAKANKLEFVSGVYVDSVTTGSAADAGGIRAKDIITRIDGVTVDQSSELQEVVARHHPGEKIQVALMRDGQQKVVTVELKDISNTEELSKSDRSLMSLLGIEVKELTTQEKRSLGLKYGVKVTRIADGKIRQLTNMRKGFIILKVDGQAVRTIEDLTKGVENKSGGIMIEGVYPDSDMIYYYGFGM